MKKNYFLIQISLFLFICSPIIIFSEPTQVQDGNYILLYESDSNDLKRTVYVENKRIYFLINDLIINSFSLDNQKFVFLKNDNETAFGLLKIQFRSKHEKSIFEFFTFDKFFAITFSKSFSFSYEEPLPRILLIDEFRFSFLYPAQGILKIFDSGIEREIKLSDFSSGEIDYLQERIGHIKLIDNEIYVFLSQIKQGNTLISELFVIEYKDNLVNRIQLPQSHIHNVFEYNGRLFISSYQIEPFFDSDFYEFIYDSYEMKNYKFIKLLDTLIEGQIKNFPRFFYSNKCLFDLKENNLVKISSCLENENIIDAIFINNAFYFLTRKDLDVNFYSFSSQFNLLEKETFEKVFYPARFLFAKNSLYLFTDTNSILLKNFAEE